MHAKVISFINLKGGVGKTTLALAAGEILAGDNWGFFYEGHYHSLYFRVLMIDLDGQSNLTYAILDEQKIRTCWDSRRTTYHFFSSFLGDVQTSLRSCICEDCSNIVSTWGRLHVIPSSFDLFDFEEKVVKTKGSRIDLNSIRRALKKSLADEGLIYKYDYIIIDCPPNLSILTSNAILASDYYVVPVIPERLSTFGLQLIKRRVNELKEEYPDDAKIEFAGAVLNRVDIRRKEHIRIAEEIIEDDFYKCFDNWIGDVKPLYTVTDFGFRKEGMDSLYYDNPYQKYGGKEKRKNPTKSDLLYWRGDGITPNYYQIRTYERIKGFVRELRDRTR